MAGAVGRFRAGKSGRILFGNTPCKLNVWSVSETGQDLDTTNFECYTEDYGVDSNGVGRAFTQGLVGQENADWNIDGNWDAARNPLDDPPGIYIRDDGPRMLLYVSRVDDTFYNFLATRVLSADVNVNAAGLVTFRASGKNQGPYLRPTGSSA